MTLKIDVEFKNLSLDNLATKEIRQKVWQPIRENASKKGIFIDFVNGYEEHCHCLVSLGVD
ncbi:MAG: transposase, partial [Flavobacteriaceae bacterium]|nr:transposase [Flavobacteriaceae bacterium]